MVYPSRTSGIVRCLLKSVAVSCLSTMLFSSGDANSYKCPLRGHVKSTRFAALIRANEMVSYQLSTLSFRSGAFITDETGRCYIAETDVVMNL